jgi:hypothetical protein
MTLPPTAVYARPYAQLAVAMPAIGTVDVAAVKEAAAGRRPSLLRAGGRRGGPYPVFVKFVR